jgi:hypothetical protein
MAFVSHDVISAKEGMRAAQATFSLMTSPGVARIGYLGISEKSVTLVILACASKDAMDLFATSTTLTQFAHPGPSTLIVVVAAL